jgi:hypothetical protein
MRTIAETNLLLRADIELPGAIKLATDEFREGWDFARTVDARRLEKKVAAQGWNFIRIADGSLRSGVGETSQEAIAGALKLALRRIGAHCNAAEVDHIELTQYPWFFLARVSVYPFLIQQSAELPESDEAQTPPATQPRRKRLQGNAEVLYPHFGSAMPLLKQMLTATKSPEARLQ